MKKFIKIEQRSRKKMEHVTTRIRKLVLVESSGIRSCILHLEVQLFNHGTWSLFVSSCAKLQIYTLVNVKYKYILKILSERLGGVPPQIYYIDPPLIKSNFYSFTCLLLQTRNFQLIICTSHYVFRIKLPPTIFWY